MGEADLVKQRPAMGPPKVRGKRPAGVERPRAGNLARDRIGGPVSTALENRRLFVVLPFAMIAGLLVYRMAGSEPDRLALGAMGCAIVLMLVVVRRSLTGIRLGALALSAWWGFALLPVHGALFGTPMLAASAYGTFSAQIDTVLSDDGGVRRILVSGIALEEGWRGVPVRRARLFVRGGPELASGDRIEGKIRFYPVPGPAVPGGYDAQFHGFFHGIGAYGSTTRPPERIAQGEESDPGRWIAKLRRDIAGRLDRHLPALAAGIARAVIVGDQSQITDETRKMMAAAGLAHVLAISGLHLSLVAGGVFAALRMGLAFADGFAQRLAAKKLAALGGIGAGLTYLALSGGSVSAIRATIMLVLVFGAVLAGRRALTMRNVAIAAIIVLAVDPASVFRPSFQLSFAAVVALIGVYELGRARRDRGGERSFAGRVLSFVAGVAVTSLVAGGATALFAAYHFQQVAPLGVIGNVFALPLVGFVMLPAGFLGVIMMPFGFEGVALAAMGWSIDTILAIAGAVSIWNWQGGVPQLTPMALVIGLAALAGFAFFGGRTRLLGPVLAVPAIAVFGHAVGPDVLVADATKAVVVRDNDGPGMGMLAGKANSFVVRVWSETYQSGVAGQLEAARCDAEGCIYRSGAGFTLALVKAAPAFAEDCGVADLVVTRLVAPAACRTLTQVIDANDLARRGVHAARWTGARNAFEINVAINDPSRPWRPQKTQ